MQVYKEQLKKVCLSASQKKPSLQKNKIGYKARASACKCECVCVAGTFSSLESSHTQRQYFLPTIEGRWAGLKICEIMNKLPCAQHSTFSTAAAAAAAASILLCFCLQHAFLLLLALCYRTSVSKSPKQRQAKTQRPIVCTKFSVELDFAFSLSTFHFRLSPARSTECPARS